jgi:hypothetical protein
MATSLPLSILSTPSDGAETNLQSPSLKKRLGRSLSTKYGNKYTGSEGDWSFGFRVIRTPARDYILLSPISLFCQPREAPSAEEFEAAVVLLSLSALSRADKMTPMNDEMLVDLEPQSPLPSSKLPSAASHEAPSSIWIWSSISLRPENTQSDPLSTGFGGIELEAPLEDSFQ